MAGRVLSIEIGYSLTRVCEVSYGTKTPKVFKSFTVLYRKPTPNHILSQTVPTAARLFPLLAQENVPTADRALFR